MRPLVVRPAALAAALGALLLAAPIGRPAAQPADVQVVDEPTGGVDLGPNGISGQHDGLATVLNPAGLHFLEGSELDLALGLGDADGATDGGRGLGLYWAGALGGGVLPRIGSGLALEFLRPSRADLAPDPGTPALLTFATSLGLGRKAALGFGWKHVFDSGPLGGLDTFDLGLAARFGTRLAAGFVIRDVGGPTVAGERVEQRYELELTGRPIGDDRLELALGGRVGQDHADLATGEDVDGWVRLSVRALRGVYLRGQLESRSVLEIATDPSGTSSRERRELRVAAGLELSFGGTGAATYATTTFDDDGDGRLAGGTAILRVSSHGPPALQGPRRRLERLDLGESIGERDLADLVGRLRRLARDPGLVAVVVQLDDMEAGWAATNELRRELIALRRAGKKVFAYLVAGSTRQYFLASAADKIFVDPAGGLRLQGFASDTLYFKGLFDQLGVVAQFEKIEEWKSAPEAYTRTGPTEPAFTMRNELYDSLYDGIVAGIASGRRLTRDRVRALIDGGPYTAGELALIPDLVDAIATPDGLTRLIAADLGDELPVDEADAPRAARWDQPTIAVVYIDGDIVDGESQVVPLLGTKLVGGETIASALEAAAASPSVRAIVLRINSPGGSALASELMAREVFAARARKPVICSMGDYAASGGYFAAAGCHLIVADPMTITGSIGIFNGKFDVSGLLGRLGISWSTFKRGAHADVESFLRPFTDAERAMMKRKLHYYYGRFIRTVARGRGLTEEQVNAVGRGHVWTGTQAMPIRLIDRYGGLGDAIALAKQRAGLGADDEIRLVELPRPTASLLGRLLGPLASEGGAASSGPAAGGAIELLRALLPGAASAYLRAALPGSLWRGAGVPQARLPFAVILSE